jgi:hypothetical protein
MKEIHQIAEDMDYDFSSACQRIKRLEAALLDIKKLSEQYLRNRKGDNCMMDINRTAIQGLGNE